MVATPPPSKKEQLNKLLERGSVFVHLDPRRDGVMVPAWLAKKPQLVLQLGLNFPIPIRDLEIDEGGVRCTLSFNRSPFYCVLPWSAVYALVAEDGQVTVWPSDLPSELVPQTEPAVRRGSPRERGEKRDRRRRISVVPAATRDGESSAAAGPDGGDDDGAALMPLLEPEKTGGDDAPVGGDEPGRTTPSASPSEAEDREAEPTTRPSQPPVRPGAPRTSRERPSYLRLVK